MQKNQINVYIMQNFNKIIKQKQQQKYFYMIQKGKAEYLLKKTYDKSRTLESFCKYEQKRFNQAQFNSTYCQKSKPSPANVLVNAETDKKVEQIKIKYGLYPKRVFKHQRSMTTGFQNQENRSVSRQPMEDHTQKFKILNNRQQSQKKPQKCKIQHRVSVTQSKNKQNPINFKIEKGTLGNLPKKNDQKLTFNQSTFNSINIIPNSHIHSNNIKTGHERKKTEQNMGGQIEEKRVLWQSNLNPRIENINKINSKIKLAIENANQIPLSQKQNFRSFSLINKQPISLSKQRPLHNDLIQTRVVQNRFLKQLRDYNTLENSKITGDKNLKDKQERPNKRARACSVNKNYNSSTNYERQCLTSFKPQKDLHIQKNFEKNKSQTKKQMEDALNQFSFQTQQQQINQEKSQTVRKNRPFQQHKYNTIRIKQDKSQYFDQAKPTNSNKAHAVENQKLSSMIKLALSSISAKKQTNQSEKYSENIQKNKQSQFKSIQTVIKRQIQLDQMLRKAKYWLKYHNTDSNKAKLKNLLFQKLYQRKQVNSWNQIQFFNTFEGKNILKAFEISDEQIDPFYSVRVQEFTYEQIIDTYFNAQDYWKQSLQSQKIIEQMISTKWVDHIDMEKKGFATVTDLTRFVNFASQGFYKNRDLILLFRRLTQDFDTLTHQIDSQKINSLAKPTLWFKESKGNKLTQDSLKKLLAQQKSNI